MEICSCPEPGYCPNYDRQMLGRLHDICQGKVLPPEKCEAYRRNWNLIAAVKGYTSPYACEHRGSQVSTTQCQTCDKSTISVPVFSCPIHGKCVVSGTNDESQLRFSRELKTVKPPEIYQCNLCPDKYVYRTGSFTGPVTRNLVYHLAPFGEQGAWQWNVRQLLKRLHVFTGKRVISVVTGSNSASLQQVQDVFGEAANSITWLNFTNDHNLREVVSFKPLFEQTQSLNPNEITFFAHTKGVTKPMNDGVTVHRWAEIMYETCLDYLPLVEQLLQKHPVVGSFKKIGAYFNPSRSSWHYSGTFYWLRNLSVFRKKNWSEIDQTWWGTETWPSLHFNYVQAGTIFYEGTGFSLYDMPVLKDVIEPAYTKWKEEHSDALQVLREVETHQSLHHP